jgi:uncharacterized membrane protein YhaH (DUF805 family)
MGSMISIDSFVLLISVCIGVSGTNPKRALLYSALAAVIIPLAIAWLEWPFLDVFQPKGQTRAEYVVNWSVRPESVRQILSLRVLLTAGLSCAISYNLAKLHVNGMNYIFNFNGRVGRVRFIFQSVLATLLLFGSIIVPIALYNSTRIITSDSNSVIMTFMFSIIIVWIFSFLAALVRRMHDVGLSGWWSLFLLSAVPLVPFKPSLMYLPFIVLFLVFSIFPAIKFRTKYDLPN